MLLVCGLSLHQFLLLHISYEHLVVLTNTHKFGWLARQILHFEELPTCLHHTP